MQVVTPSSFLLLHGWENHRPAPHWQRWLSLELMARGHDVRYPQLPNADEPVRADWRAAALANLATLTEGPVTVICHSLSCLMWLHEQQSGSAPQVDRVVLVSPPAASFVLGRPAIADFAWYPVTGSSPLAIGAEDALLIAGDDDPYMPEGLAGIAPHVVARPVSVPAGGHLIPATGYGPWPEMLDWCLGLPAFGG